MRSRVCSPGGVAENFGSNDFLSYNVTFQGSTLMHQLGHTMGLTHGGPLDESSANCKPNYLSIMNYNNFEIESLVGPPIIDYSPPRKSDGTRGRGASSRFSAPPGAGSGPRRGQPEGVGGARPERRRASLRLRGWVNRDRLSPVGAPVD